MSVSSSIRGWEKKWVILLPDGSDVRGGTVLINRFCQSLDKKSDRHGAPIKGKLALWLTVSLQDNLPTHQLCSQLVY